MIRKRKPGSRGSAFRLVILLGFCCGLRLKNLEYGVSGKSVEALGDRDKPIDLLLNLGLAVTQLGSVHVCQQSVGSGYVRAGLDGELKYFCGIFIMASVIESLAPFLETASRAGAWGW